ncbi:ABC transporter ATP-binding protein [Streptomyces sp. P1-3]|uniref:ABC transporter ATP-binding protein n=1 Tax=Streptomyces sp. P1-3 TaxID=3421658 RepID=UPI003D364237
MAWQKPGWFATFAVASVAAAATALLMPLMLKATTDAVLTHDNETAALAELGVVLAVNVAAQVTAGHAAAVCVIGTATWLRRTLLQHILALGVQGTGRYPAADLTSRLLGDAAMTAQALPLVVGIATSLGTSIGGAVALWLIDPLLGLTFVLGLPPALLLIRRFMADSTDLHVRYQRSLTAIAVRMSDALTGVRTIRAAGTTSREVERVLGPLPELAEIGQATWSVQRGAVWRGMLLMPMIEAMVLAVAGLGVGGGWLSPGQLIASLLYLGFALGFFSQIDALMEFAGLRASAQRVVEILSEHVQRTAAEPCPIPAGPGDVAFRGVTVRAGGRMVLDRVDLQVWAGTSLALVGRSGAGKSTLAALVGRLADADEGTVLLDQVDVGALDPVLLRRQIAYAFERPVLFGDTVAEAIGYARPAATRAEVEHAASAVRADAFIRRLPDGYDSPLSRTPLSGGEAQRLGLARAVLQDARVLVLDDATSSLDTVTEAQISATLTELFRDRTRIIVAHRAATAARADLVAWLDDGRVRAVAPHASLWQYPDYRVVFGAPGPTTTWRNDEPQ